MKSTDSLDFGALAISLQSHLGDGLVIVAGSGLSCAEGLPGMGALAQHLEANIPDLIAPEELDHWAEIAIDIRAVGLEAALIKRPPSPKLEAAIVQCSAKLILDAERRVVSEVFSGQRTLQFTRLVQHLLKPSAGLPVVTTNYDRLIEIAVEEAGLGADTLFVGDFAGTLNEAESRMRFCREVKLQGKMVRSRFKERAIVLKPHGSLDWYHRAGKPVRYAGELELPRLIITPGLNKFRNGYESPFDRHREMANSAINKARRFLVVGYGFNDDHLETHLKPRIASGAPTLLLTQELSPNALALALAHGNVIALDRSSVSEDPATRVIMKGVVQELRDKSLWDLSSFITEVLEP